jgi:hypothetical protein
VSCEPIKEVLPPSVISAFWQAALTAPRISTTSQVTAPSAGEPLHRLQLAELDPIEGALRLGKGWQGGSRHARGCYHIGGCFARVTFSSTVGITACRGVRVQIPLEVVMQKFPTKSDD